MKRMAVVDSAQVLPNVAFETPEGKIVLIVANDTQSVELVRRSVPRPSRHRPSEPRRGRNLHLVASPRGSRNMQLGAFSVSLTVKDLEASRKFYECFGFQPFAGNAAQNWLILKNGDTVIGLFQGMFDEEHPYLQSRLGPKRPKNSTPSPTSATSSAN